MPNALIQNRNKYNQMVSRNALSRENEQERLNMVLKILNQNKSKEFVDRILNRDKYPVLNNPDGSYSTHSMGWSGIDNGYIVYPTVVMQGKELKRLNDNDAINYALKTGEYINFDNPDQADWFSKNYKAVWPGF